MKNSTKALIKLVLSMVIWSTLGFCRQRIDLPSGTIAAIRGFVGAAFLLVVGLMQHDPVRPERIRDKWPVLVLSGAFIGINWIFLFEAYRYTTVAVASLSYYMEPVFLTLGAVVFFKERISSVKSVLLGLSVAGIVLVSGVLQPGGLAGSNHLLGVLCGLAAAVLYAVVTLLNQTTAGVPAMERTIVQLLTAGVVATPYALLVEQPTFTGLSVGSVLLLAVICIMHTGMAFWLFFGSMGQIESQRVALLSYTDPVLTVLLSAFLFREPQTWQTLCGAVLILGSAIFSEWLSLHTSKKVA